jgi:hypothetical protein
MSQAHTLVREDDRFCCADFRLSRYSEAPLRSQQTHTSHLYAKALLRKPSTREGLVCALFTEKGIESRKASGRLKVEHPFLIVKRRLKHVRKHYRGIEKTSCMLESASPLQTLPMCIFAGRLHLPAPRVA